MKIGEIKLQALSLIFPDAIFEYKDEDLEELILSLKASSNYASFLVASVGAINRAMASIEQKGLSNRGLLELRLEYGSKIGDYYYFDLEGKKEICSVDEVYLITDTKRTPVEFEFHGSTMAVKCQNSIGRLHIAYREKIKRIDYATENTRELSLSCGIEEAIPYFVKADLLLGERPEEATLARNIYEGMLEEYRGKENESTAFDTVYSLGSV